MEYVASREVPPVVYVPVTGGSSEGRAPVEVRRLANGQLAIAAFTALDRPREELGHGQAWMLVHLADLERQASTSDISRVLLDPHLPSSRASGGSW